MSELRNRIPEAVCRRWFEADCEARPLAGGLSGATAWAVDHGGHHFVLKSFAAAASRTHAEWVHAFMQAVRRGGVAQVPAVVPAVDSQTVQADDVGTLWELLEWMPGEPIARPVARQVMAAAEVLAHVHQAAAAWSGHAGCRDHSPAVLHRIARARDLLRRPWAARLRATFRGPLRERLIQAISIFAAAGGEQAVARVATWESRPVAVQPVLRDVWRDHVLFVGEQMTGVIDWHAAGVDAAATDIARLVGSWPSGSAIGALFLDAYVSVRPLEHDERALVPFLQATGILFGLDNWFRWTVEENRSFADTSMVEGRFDALLAALPDAVQNLANGMPLGADGNRRSLD